MFRILQRPIVFGSHIAFGESYSAKELYIRYDHRKEALPAIFLKTSRMISFLPAAIHYCLITAGYLNPPTSVCRGNKGKFRVLKCIWYARIVKKLISVLIHRFVRGHLLALVNGRVSFPSNSGCVITSCHTPWRKLLVQWCLENDFLMIAANGRWTGEEKSIQLEANGFNGLRQIVRHLRQKGRVFIAMDTFNGLDNCPVSFLGESFNASTFPARLAKLAQVPLEMIVPVLSNTTIDIIHGPGFDLKSLNKNPSAVTRELVSFLEHEIRNDPSIWEPFVK